MNDNPLNSMSSKIQGRGSLYFVLGCLAGLMAIAAYIRINGVGAYYLNSDEILYLRMAQGKNIADVLSYTFNETHPPLFTLLLHYWIKISDSIAFLRSCSLCFGLLLIPIYFLVGTMLRDSFAGLCCAVLVVFGYGEIVESYILRNYSFLIFCLSLCFYYMLRWHREKSLRALAWYFFWGLLTCLGHFASIFPILCMGAGEIIFLMYAEKRGRTQKMIAWMAANLVLACAMLPLYLIYRPAFEYYKTGTSASHLLLSKTLITHSLFSPLASISYLLPYVPSALYALTLYCTCIALIIHAFRLQGPVMRFLIYLMLMAFLVNFLIHALGLNTIQGLTASYAFTRHDLWLMPFVIPVAGTSFSYCAGPYLRNLSVTAKRCSGIAAIIAFFVIFHSSASRFADGEYMIKTSTFSALQNSLEALDSHSVIIADRITGFLLIPEQDNPYQYMSQAQWADKSTVRMFPYYNTQIAFNGENARLVRKEELYKLYNSPQIASLPKTVSQLVFVNLQQGSWKSAVLEKLADCASLDKKITLFPQDEVRLISISRQSFETELLSPEGKAHMCLN